VLIIFVAFSLRHLTFITVTVGPCLLLASMSCTFANGIMIPFKSLSSGPRLFPHHLQVSRCKSPFSSELTALLQESGEPKLSLIQTNSLRTVVMPKELPNVPKLMVCIAHFLLLIYAF